MVMNDIYRGAANPPESSFNFDQEALISTLKRIYEKDFNPVTQIDEGLFRSIWNTLNQATDEGFISMAGDHDADFLEAIKHNNAVFSAFKTHRLQNDVAAQLLNTDGELKPLGTWLRDTEDIVDHQVGDWLETEYNTAVIRAHQAADWRQFEREKDILPNLKWNPSTSLNPGLDHKVFWNRIWSIDDPFWQKHRPGDRWNCKCSLSSTDEPVTDNSDIAGDNDEPSPGLGGNPGKTAKIFSDDHPYVQNAHKGAAKAVGDFLKEKVEINHFDVVKTFKNGGSVQIHPQVNKKLHDYKSIRKIADEFARLGQEVKIVPSVHYRSTVYEEIYGALYNTKYWRKCPDLKIGDYFYEYESFIRPFKKEKIFAMISHGLKQSDRIIIDNTKGASDRIIEKSIRGRLKNNMKITEVWVYEKGKIRQIYPKKAEPHK